MSLLLWVGHNRYGCAGVWGWSPEQGSHFGEGLISARATCQVGWGGSCFRWDRFLGITEVGCMVLARLMESDRYGACQHQASWVIVFHNYFLKMVFSSTSIPRESSTRYRIASLPHFPSLCGLFFYNLSHRKSVQFTFRSVSEILVLCVAVVCCVHGRGESMASLPCHAGLELSSGTILRPHHFGAGVTISPPPWRHLSSVCFFDSSRPNECEVISHCDLIYASLMFSEAEYFFNTY